MNVRLRLYDRLMAEEVETQSIMSRLHVEGWAPEYGAPLDISEERIAKSPIDPSVETTDWSPIPGDASQAPDVLAFVDGVRRIDARLTLDDPIEGPVPGIVGAIQRALPGGATGYAPAPAGPAGQTVMGRYGAGMTPIAELRNHRTCLSGMVLGNDGICYNRKDVTNREREWPRGRRPLLTGGDRNAITRAARAARAIQRTEKQLQKLGMLKKPSRRAAPRPPAMRQLAPGPSIINVE